MINISGILWRFLFTLISITLLLSLIFIYLSAKKLESSIHTNNSTTYTEDVTNSKYYNVKKPKGYKELEVRKHIAKNIKKVDSGHYLIEFEKNYFGTIAINLNGNKKFTVKFYEIDKDLFLSNKKKSSIFGKNIAYNEGSYTFIDKNGFVTLDINERFRPRPDELPNNFTGVTPFRFVEIIGYDSELQYSDIYQVSIHYPFDDGNFNFTSNNASLDKVVELSKHTIKATTFSGIYVDGNRERKPYEADAYIQQLGHYSIDSDYSIARYTLDYLLKNPTWPTEWIMHSIFIAHADYMYTGDKEYIKKIYGSLRKRSLIDLEDNDGLINSSVNNQSKGFLESINRENYIQDIIDWPPVERDDFEMENPDILEYIKLSSIYYLKSIRLSVVEILGFRRAADEYRLSLYHLKSNIKKIPNKNVIVNLFHYSAISKLGFLACEIGENEDCTLFKEKASILKKNINMKFFNKESELYTDSIYSKNSSFHSNLFALSFGLIPSNKTSSVISFLKENNGKGSTYATHYLLEGLYKYNESDYALNIMTSNGKRSWLNMIDEFGITTTTESWSLSINPTMDLNHAWSTAPVNIVSRWLVGVRPISPAFKKFIIAPQPSVLENFKFKMMTIPGEINVNYEKLSNYKFTLNVKIPTNSNANIYLPLEKNLRHEIYINGKLYITLEKGDNSLGEIGAGSYHISVLSLQ